MDMEKCEVFHHKAMRRKLKMSMAAAKEEKIKNEMVRKMLLNEEALVDSWMKRQLLFLGRIAGLSNNECPKILFTATCDDKRARGRPYRTARDAMVENMRKFTPNVDVRGEMNSWM